ncbi:MAG: ABC transporter permease [Limnochordaceae bacterium]|nr:ABC transporter permease [Limnochordaceae bacterium]
MRLGLAVPIILILVSIMFLILRVMPGDPVLAMLGGRNVSPQVIAEYRQRLGLDRPLLLQYVDYLGQVARGDFGTSIRTGRPVIQELLERFPATLELAVSGMLVAFVLGLAGGMVAATRAGRAPDHAMRLANVGFFAMPIFWFGLMLQMVFAVRLHWFPVGGRLDPVTAALFEPRTGFYALDALLERDWQALGSALHHMVLPAVTLGVVLSGVVGRLSRTRLLEVLDADYVRTARAKGLEERRVLWVHALRNAMIPIVTVVGMQFALLLAGAVLTETVFSWPGIGRYLLMSIDYRDFPAIQGSVVFIALFISVINLLVDMTYPLLDPRVRF